VYVPNGPVRVLLNTGRVATAKRTALLYVVAIVSRIHYRVLPKRMLAYEAIRLGRRKKTKEKTGQVRLREDR